MRRGITVGKAKAQGSASCQTVDSGALLRRSVLSLAALLTIGIAGCTHENPPTANPPTTAGTPTTGGAAAKKKIVFVFKIGGISYSEACKAGAEQANSDPALNVDVQYNAAPEGTADKQ